MARYDTLDEAMIKATPAEVWRTLLREFSGERHRWLPELEFRPLTPTLTPGVGIEVEVIPHVPGERRLPVSLSFVERSSSWSRNERLAADYVAGPFLGRGEWLLAGWSGRLSSRLAAARRAEQAAPAGVGASTRSIGGSARRRVTRLASVPPLAH